MNKEESKGILYINYSKDAEPLADEKILDKIKEQYEIVKGGTQNKQFNVSNGLVFTGVQLLCQRGDLITEKIVFMRDGVELKMEYDKLYSSNVNVPAWVKGVPTIIRDWLNELLGIDIPITS